jgi:Zn-dependent peptidase ImmA (M78 family)/transcriptional regulator with XRE-family HTH domain
MKSQELARAVGVDPSAMSNIESGKRGVKTGELSRIAKALGVSPLAILDESSLVARMPVSPRVDTGSRGAAPILTRLEAFAELHHVLAIDGIAAPANFVAPPIDVRNWRESAESLATWTLGEFGVLAEGDERFSALADAIEERLRVDVVIEDISDGTWAGAAITDHSFPLVFVRASQPRPRALFTLAHELAHVLAGDGDTFTIDETLTAHTDRERFANAFAATYLMPADEVHRLTENGIGPTSVARMLVKFGVSFESLVYRLHNLGYIDYRGRNHLQSSGIRGLFAELDNQELARILLARLGERGEVETRPPAWLAVRCLDGYRRGIVSARPLAGLLGQDPDELLEMLQASFPYEDADALLQAGAEASDEERYSGSPV